MTNENPIRRTLYRIGYFAASLFLLSVIVFLIVGIKDARRAAHLRNDVCELEPGKSTFAEVSRIFPKYGGYVGSHDDTPPSCSPDGCFYVLYVENPISKLIPIFPRTALFATVRIFDNTLRERSLSIAETKGQHYREAFVKQSADSHFKEDTRIITESMVPRKGVAVRADNSAHFIELANGLRLACLVFPGACAAPDDMLPYLKSRQVPD
jgi:hypothetical protein